MLDKENVMANVPKQVQEFFPGKLAWVATATKDGVPNVTPKGSLRVLDDEHVIFADLFSLKTRSNLTENPKVAVTVVDQATHTGYQLKGTAEMISSGPLFEEVSAQVKALMSQLPAPTYVVKIAVEAVYDQSAGASAGKQIV
jgi:predicted pyridoxine 5'-phosphate oxidase superfamily flavin-nucleotide-binding protein